MAESECTHDCSTCGANCSSRSSAPTFEPMHEGCHAKHVIGIVSGKGGVGKSIVTSMLAVALRRHDHSVGILDADITGPSIPKAFGTHGDVLSTGDGLLPLETKTGIKMISVNLLLDEETRPVVWRGPVIAGTVKQFWTDVIWGELEYLLIDMPPGTGDVPLTVFQTLPVDGIIVVTSPQELVGLIVEKAVKMANMMNVPILGIVENMSYAVCPDCGKKLYVFGESHVQEIAARYHLPVLAQCPIDPELAKQADLGVIESFETDHLDKAADVVEALLKEK